MEARQLLYMGWTDPNGPLQLNRDLASGDLNEVGVVYNSRLVLGYVAEREPLSATGTGDFKRTDVKELMEDMKFLRADYTNDVYDMNRVINEQDVVPLHTLRTVLEIGGFNIRDETMRVSSKANKLLKEDHIGTLFAELFSIYFREYNIAYYTRGPELERVQDTIEFTLYKLHQLTDDWYSKPELTEEGAHPMMLEQYPDSDLEKADNPLPLVYSQRVFRPLSRFGLLDMRKIDEDDPYSVTIQYRKTPLFDRFLSFQFS